MRNLVLMRVAVGGMVAGLAIAGCSVKSKRVEEPAVAKEAKSQEETQAAAAVPAPPEKQAVEILVPPAEVAQPKVSVDPIPKAAPKPVETAKVEKPAAVKQEPSAVKQEPSAKNQEPAKEAPVAAKEPAKTPMIEAQSKAQVTAPKSTGPDHFVITVAEKNSSHPHFGKGHKLGFSVNGEPGKELVVQRSKAYRFEVATDPKHDVYFSTKEIGWGSSPWADGVEGAFIYNGIINVKLDDKAPKALYYSCRNHPYMGGRIHVVNPGETVAIKKGKSSSGAAETEVKVTAGMVNQKLMFAQMLMKSQSFKSLTAVQRQTAEELVAGAKQDSKAGNHQQAFAAAEKALVILKNKKSASAVAKDNPQVKAEYKELTASIADYEKSHADNVKRVKKAGKSKPVNYDKDKVAALKKKAEDAAKQNDYESANHSLHEAQNLITKALQGMLHSTTIVYDLNFETPQEEYEYELKRFGGYEELIPVAIEAKKPAEGAKKLMQMYLKKGRDMREAAVKKAASGDFPVAIAMLLDATKEVRRALRMVGVMQ